MNRPVKTFVARVVNKDGWDFPDAFVAIWHAEDDSKTSYTSEDCKSNYVNGLSSRVIMYKGNYWGKKEQQLKDLCSLPLAYFRQVPEEVVYKVGEDGEYSLDDNGEYIPTGKVIDAHEVWDDMFYVDLDHLQSIQVLNSTMSPEDKTFRLIELDVQRRFPA